MALQIPDQLFDDPELEHRWRARVRCPRTAVPTSDRISGSRSVYTSNASGRTEVYVWDRAADTHRRVTDREHGTLDAGISADGDGVWWFADHAGNEFGHWMKQPFGADQDAAQPAAPGVPDGYPSGIGVGRHIAVLGMVTDEDGFTTWAVRPDAEPVVLYRHAEDGVVGPLSCDERHVVIRHSEHGDSRNPALRVVDTTSGITLGNRHDDGHPLHPCGWDPVEGHARLLVRHERARRGALLLWDLHTDTEIELDIPLDGELTGSWYRDGTALLVHATHQGRDTLHRYDLASGGLSPLPAAAGSISAARTRPDDTVEYGWSSAATSWQVRVCRPDGIDEPLPFAIAKGVRPSVPVRDEWIPGPGGPIHTLISAPAHAAGPGPTVFRLHGGPHMADADAFNAMRATWVEAGYTVVNVNYRGSSGYGQSWRDAITGRPGLTELEDVAAVYDWCLLAGITDPARAVVEGYSWGGYLALLAAGTQPERWACTIAGLPIADYLAAYEDEAPPLKAMDRALFGGAPEDRHDAYVASSPITYVADVTAPVLIIAGANDPRCPIRQIDNYLRALEEHGQKPHVHRDGSGHGPTDTKAVETFLTGTITFANRALSRVTATPP